MKMSFLLFAVLCAALLCSWCAQAKLSQNVDKIVIWKERRKMEVYHQNQLLKTYSISLGFAPIGPKEKEGDGKTPEGNYTISAKNKASKFHKSLKISYPSPEDRKRARKKGISPGGDIMIHGLPNGYSSIGKAHLLQDWTLGCVAVTSTEIDELFPQVALGVLVTIYP